MVFRTRVCTATLGAMFLACAVTARAQDPKQLVREAVNAELAAARADQNRWRYVKHEANGNGFIVVETANGEISRHITEAGHAPSAATLKADDDAIRKFIHDPSLQVKQRHDGEHDDKSATELLNLMPQAFLWKIESETPELINLSYRPNPGFSPPDMESRVMGGMSGTLVVAKEGHRIRTFRGKLETDVTLGFGVLARLRQGSTFDIERRQVSGAFWEITETHVHIAGHALFFKNISTQEDEVKSSFTPVPPGTTLEQAVTLLNEPIK